MKLHPVQHNPIRILEARDPRTMEIVIKTLQYFNEIALNYAVRDDGILCKLDTILTTDEVTYTPIYFYDTYGERWDKRLPFFVSLSGTETCLPESNPKLGDENCEQARLTLKVKYFDMIQKLLTKKFGKRLEIL